MKKNAARRAKLPKSEGLLDERVAELAVYHAGESPNRILLPRKIGKKRPEEERGWKPIVI